MRLGGAEFCPSRSFFRWSNFVAHRESILPLNNGKASASRFRFTLAVVAISLMVSARRSNEAQVSGSPRLVSPRLDNSFLSARHFGPLAFARPACVEQNPVSQWTICRRGNEWDNSHFGGWQSLDRAKLRNYERLEERDMGAAAFPVHPRFRCCRKRRNDIEIVGCGELDISDYALFLRPE